MCRVAVRLLTGWRWCQPSHREAPLALQAAVRTMLLINRRGFPLAASAAGTAGGSGGYSTQSKRAALGAGSAAEQEQRQRQGGWVSLEPELLLQVLELAGADLAPWVRCSYSHPKLWRVAPWDVPPPQPQSFW